MTLTTSTGQRFPRLRINPQFPQTYYVLLPNDPEFGEQELAPSVLDMLQMRGWFLTNNAAVYIRSLTPGLHRSAHNDRIKQLYSDLPAYVKQVASNEGHIPYGDLREAFGMPREKQFAQISEVTLSLTIPYAMNALPDKLRCGLRKTVEQKIVDYVMLGQDELHVYYRDDHARLDPHVRVFLRGMNPSYRQEVAVVNERVEWQQFVQTIVGFIDEARIAAIQEIEYSQLEVQP